MHRLKLFPRLIRDRCGATMLEYGLILGVMSIVIIAVASLFGSNAIDSFNALSSNVETASDKMPDSN